MNVIVACVLAVLFLLLLFQNYKQDAIDHDFLGTCISHKEVPVAPLPAENVLQIESVIANYLEKNSRNVSNVYVMKNAVMTGIMNGVVIGLLANDPLHFTLGSSVVYGIVAGAIEGHRMIYMKPSTLRLTKT